jgi:quinol monooxygenase YgiN
MNSNRIKYLLIFSFFITSTIMVAQENEQPFMVTYIEVLPGYEDQVVTLLSHVAYEAREHAGNLRYQAFQRIGRLSHFAIFETWLDENSMMDFRTQLEFTSYRETIKSVTYSPYDERPSTAIFDTPNQGQQGTVYAITHIDIIPTALEDGRVIINGLVRATRDEVGAIEIAIMEQNNRRNHFTLIETWSTFNAQASHLAESHTINFRNELLPRSGSLYDERLYRLIN